MEPKIIEMWISILQLLAIIIAGIWAFVRFRIKREDRTQAVLDLEIEHFKVDNKKILVRVKVIVKNVGNVLLEPSKSTVTVYEVIPLKKIKYTELLQSRPSIGYSDDTLSWPTIDKREQNLSNGELVIEPNETDEIWTDFIINDGLKVIQVYARVDFVKGEDGYRGAVKLIEI